MPAGADVRKVPMKEERWVLAGGMYCGTKRGQRGEEKRDERHGR